MNSVVHFEMPYDDRGRIARFYDQAFGWQTQALGEDIESPMSSPWKPKLTGERRSKLLNMIAGFEIEITHIQGKFKLSQNRPLEDQPQVIEKLSQSNNQTDTAVAKLMSGVIHDKS